MKQKYEFYLTVEEARWNKIGFTGLPFYAMMISIYLVYVFCSLLIIGRALDLTIQDTYVKVFCVLALIAGVLFVVFSILLITRRNFSPTSRYWNAKHEYIIEGDKITLHLTGVGVSQTDSFIIKKRKETKFGTVLYKSNFYYLIIPHRVKPIEIE